MARKTKPVDEARAEATETPEAQQLADAAAFDFDAWVADATPPSASIELNRDGEGWYRWQWLMENDGEEHLRTAAANAIAPHWFTVRVTVPGVESTLRIYGAAITDIPALLVEMGTLELPGQEPQRLDADQWARLVAAIGGPQAAALWTLMSDLCGRISTPDFSLPSTPSSL